MSVVEIGLFSGSIIIAFIIGLSCCKNNCVLFVPSPHISIEPPKYEAYKDTPPSYEDPTRTT